MSPRSSGRSLFIYAGGDLLKGNLRDLLNLKSRVRTDAFSEVESGVC